jgi:predicted AAA+ superfamily ATPase
MLEPLFLQSRDFVRLFDRAYVRYFLKNHPMTHRMAIIAGPRGVGKTTALIQHLRIHHPDITTREALYLSADHHLAQNHSLFEIADAFYKNEGKRLYLDEIHKNPDWSAELKQIHDTHPRLQVIATGSSALELAKGSHDLSRRAIFYTMHGLSFREFVQMQTGLEFEPVALQTLLLEHESKALDVIGAIEGAGRRVLGLFADYLQSGYYPYSGEYEDRAHFFITLQQQIDTTLESDFLAVNPSFNGLSIRKMKKLLAIIAESVPFTLELKVLKNASEIHDDRTLKNYLFFLERSGIIRLVYRSRSGLRALEKPEKIMLGNPNLIAALGANTGSLRECFFLTMLENAGHRPILAKSGDFELEGPIVFEVGGPNKTARQIKNEAAGYLALDQVEHGIGRKIPLWLFGFLY